MIETPQTMPVPMVAGTLQSRRERESVGTESPDHHLVRNTALLERAPAPRRKPLENFAGRRIHFMGAGGIGVSALMELCAARGALVSGCDCSGGGQAAALREKGFRVEHGHSASHAEDCDELVYTAAVDAGHPEIQAALNRGLAARSRMNMLGRVAAGSRAVCVTGAHGKTTTTWLIAHLLIAAGRDPSVYLGGVAPALNGNVRVGRGAEFVAETDESDNRLHEIAPSIPVLTNIDNDHLEHYGSLEAIEQAAERFMASADAADELAILIGCGDDARVRRVLAGARRKSRVPSLAYGFSQHCQIRGLNVVGPASVPANVAQASGLRRNPEDCATGWCFDALTPTALWRDLELPLSGRHNVLNALAAIGVAWRLGLEEDLVRTALATVEPVGRRFEIKGVVRGVRVIDDYGHHPVEIVATLEAARASTPGRLGVLFQPHRYSRTAALMQDFARCFSQADAVFLLPVYAASEPPIPGVDHYALAEAIGRQVKAPVVTLENRAEAVALLGHWAREGDTLVTQGAGDVTKAAEEILDFGLRILD